MGTTEGASRAALATASVPPGHRRSPVTSVAGFGLFRPSTSRCFVVVFDGVHSIPAAGFLARRNYFGRPKPGMLCVLSYVFVPGGLTRKRAGD